MGSGQTLPLLRIILFRLAIGTTYKSDFHPFSSKEEQYYKPYIQCDWIGNIFVFRTFLEENHRNFWPILQLDDRSKRPKRLFGRRIFGRRFKVDRGGLVAQQRPRFDDHPPPVRVPVLRPQRVQDLPDHGGLHLFGRKDLQSG